MAVRKLEVAIGFPKADWKWAALCLWTLLACCGSARAQEEPTILVGMPLGQIYTPGEWVPMWVKLENPTDQPIDGYSLIPISDESGGMVVRIPARVPARARVQLMAYGRFLAPAAGKSDAKAPSLTIPTWQRMDGSRVARTQVMGRPLVAGESDPNGLAPGTPGSIILTIDTDAPSWPHQLGALHETQGFSELLQALYAAPMGTASVQGAMVPRHRAGYEACRLVVLDGTNPDSLDTAQRQALLDYVRGGGILILPVPLDDADPTTSWLAPYVPVKLIGRRELSQIDLEAGSVISGTLKLQQTVEVCEAVDNGGHVVLRDGAYVHAAYKQVGLGRVVFVSFPVGAPVPDERVAAMWKALLGDRIVPAWAGSELAERPQPLLEPLIGRPTIPWLWAAGIAGGYVLFVVVLQLVTSTARRPTAFAAVVVGALALAGALVAATTFKTREAQLAGARLAVLDVTDQGGVQREIVGFAGKDDPAFALQADREESDLRPVISTETQPPVIEVRPFSAPDAGVWRERVRRLWQAESPLAADKGLIAKGIFGPQGLILSVENRLGETLQAPIVVWDTAAYSLEDAAAGSVQLPVKNRNVPGDYTNSAMLTSESAKLRGQMLRASLAGAGTVAMGQKREVPPLLTGWLEDAAVTKLLRPTAPAPLRTLGLVRTPLHIEPTPVGTRVHVDSGFVRMLTEGSGMPYDSGKQQWVRSSQDVQWIFGFAAPQQIGSVKTLEATVEVDLDATQQTITLRRGQCPAGKPEENAQGAVVAEWKNTIGHRTVSFTCEPGDLDAQHRLWLQVQVQGPGPADMNASWAFRSFAVTLEGQVVEDTPATPNAVPAK